LQAKLRDNPLDAARADRNAALAQFLGNDLDGGIRVEKTVADDLLDDLIGPAVMGLRTALLIEQGEHAAEGEGAPELEVALATEAKLGGGGGRSQSFALAFEEHGEFGQNQIGLGRAQRAAGTFEGQGVFGGF
jgi:hypothetical protein